MSDWGDYHGIIGGRPGQWYVKSSKLVKDCIDKAFDDKPVTEVRRVILPDGTAFMLSDWGDHASYSRAVYADDRSLPMETVLTDNLIGWVELDDPPGKKTSADGRELTLNSPDPVVKQAKKEDICVVCEGTFHGLTFLNGAMYCPRCNGMVHEGCTQKKDLWDGKGKRNYCLICFEQMEKK
jgi:hypothetical protein